MTLTVKLWDREEPINGVSPEVVLAGFTEGTPDGAPVVLVCDGPQVVVLQPFDPREPGAQPFEDDDAALDYGRQVVQQMTNPPAPSEPSTPTEPAPSGPTAEEFAQLRADLDWIINFAVTGEA